MKTDVKLPEEGAKPSSLENPSEKSSVHVDFRNKEKVSSETPFQKAKLAAKRVKLFLWGDSGVGKTTLSLRFPKPVVIDMEGGTDLYAESFNFDVLKATNADQVMEAVDWLLTNKHDFRTLIIDPITVYWDALQKKWSDIFLKRNKGSKGYRFEFYDLQPRDWMTLKAEFKELIRKLIALDMTVIVTARQKPQYKEGSFMLAIGETFDGEKSLPYMFDTILRLYVDEKGRHMATCLKDRSNKLPKEPFEAKYDVFESLLGKSSLAKKSEPHSLSTPEQKAKIRGFIEALHLSSDYVEQRLSAYGAETLDDLNAKDADTIIKKLEAATAAKNQKTKEDFHA